MFNNDNELTLSFSSENLKTLNIKSSLIPCNINGLLDKKPNGDTFSFNFARQNESISASISRLASNSSSQVQSSCFILFNVSN